MGVVREAAVAAIKPHNHRLLTAKGGQFEVREELQEILCLTDDGVLYVSEAHVKDHHVLGFMARLQRAGFQFKVERTSLHQIRELYTNAVVTSPEEEATVRQDEVIQLIKHAVNLGASDIHFVVGRQQCEIKARVHGELLKHLTVTRQHGLDLCATIYQSMCDVADPIFVPSRKQDARLKAEFVHQCGLFGARVATTPTDDGLFMVLRLLYDSGLNVPTLEALGYLPEQVMLIRRMEQLRKGINIFSGPTGSGKSTTLRTVLTHLIDARQGKINVLTVEDPPEYRIRGAVQTPLLGDKDDPEAVSRGWARAISNAMRLDPDVIMVGEMRDLDSAAATFRAGMTGHSVWTTLHANDSISILERLRDLGVELSLLTDPALVTGLISQVLVRKLCTGCRKPYLSHKASLDADLIDRIERTCNTEAVYLKGDGCPQCKGTGVGGRTVVAEVVMPTMSLMDAFKSEGKAGARVHWVQRENGITMNQHVLMLVNQGIVDPRTAESDVCLLDEDFVTLGK